MHRQNSAEAEEDPGDELAGGLARLKRDHLCGGNSPTDYEEFAELLCGMCRIAGLKRDDLCGGIRRIYSVITMRSQCDYHVITM